MYRLDSNVMWNINKNNASAQVDHTLLPGFWKHSPKDWFMHAESVFYDRQIKTNIKKTNHVLSALDEDAVRVVRDLTGSCIINYNDIKQRLISTYTVDGKIKQVDRALDSDKIDTANLRLVGDNNHFRAIQRTILNLTTRVTDLLTVHVPQYLCSIKHGQQNDLCYYHNRFGDCASICQPPCSYQSGILAEVVEESIPMFEKQTDINFLDKPNVTAIIPQADGSDAKQNSIPCKKRVCFNLKTEINVIDTMSYTTSSENPKTFVKKKSCLKKQQVHSKLQSKECCKIQ